VRALVVARAAEEDLLAIWTYLRAQSERAADRIVDGIAEQFDLLLRHPLIGRSRPELGIGYRSLAVGSYVIFYRASEDKVEISRVLHGARDLTAILHAEDTERRARESQTDDGDGDSGTQPGAPLAYHRRHPGMTSPCLSRLAQ